MGALQRGHPVHPRNAGARRAIDDADLHAGELQAVHALTHPTAKLERRPPADDAGPALVKTTVSADELFAHLAAEDDDTAEDDAATAPGECGT